MLAKGIGGASRVLAPSVVVAAAGALLVPGGNGPYVAAAGVGAAILAVWITGSSGGLPGRDTRRRDRLTAVGLALSVGAGTALAAGIFDGPGPFGLPRSLWGLLLGVWLLPLVITSLGFALSFRPPNAADLERLRAAVRRDA